uniref:C-type lectin domain-containing protein n=1 Tax=Labrus bergylta TaxID=56723 RepID=A0A3Q3KT97_9LABR
MACDIFSRLEKCVSVPFFRCAVQTPSLALNAFTALIMWENGLYSSLLDYGFFCFNLMVDEVKKTWEEALEHCRETHTNLTSLNSETERLLALSEIQHDRITKRVWIGLRFLGDRWLWVNGDPLVYEAWPEGDQEHQCPLRKRCGALTKEGHWENWDCEEKLHFICY